MKAMAAELNMYQAQVNEYKYEIERLTRELQDMKRKYYEQKRREQMQREAQQRLEPRVIHQPTAPVQRFTGGGFNLAIWDWDQELCVTRPEINTPSPSPQINSMSHLLLYMATSSCNSMNCLAKSPRRK